MTNLSLALDSHRFSDFFDAWLPGGVQLCLQRVERSDEQITLVVASAQATADCPRCDQPSLHIQSRYVRTLADHPLAATPVRVRLHVRRFFCRNAACQRRIFTERIPSMMQPSARRTTRLRTQLVETAFALGGEAGARFARRSGMAVSPDTLLGLMRQQRIPVSVTPRVLGVDDWSFRRGRNMGTILVDLERRMPIDLLPQSSEESFAAWLHDHPGVEIISRDRGAAYARGGTTGAPDAIQIADRWHLLKNMGDAVQKLLARHLGALRSAAHPPCDTPPVGDAPAACQWPVALPVKQRLHRPKPPMLGAHRQRQLAMHQAVRVAIDAGQSVNGIAQRLQLSRSTVRKYRDMAIFHDQRTTARPSATEPYRTYLEQRWAMGYTQVRQLWHELQAQGYRGSYRSVWQFTRQWHLPTVIADANVLVVASPQPLRTPRHVRWLLTRPSDTYTPEEQTYCARLFQHCPDIAVAAPLIQAFSAMIRGQQHDRLDEWVACAEHCSVRELHRFALSVQEDLVAVRAALTYPWSQGQVEGQVTRLKLVKRQMYGRATFGLLRARVLHRG